MSFAYWPSEPATLPPDSRGLICGQQASDLMLPREVLQQVRMVTRRLSIPEIQAVWLSGSATRGQLRRHSDIDWVVVTDGDLHLDSWPTTRHSFQIYKSDVFLRSLGDGHEFSVWQLAYGHPIYTRSKFHETLLQIQIAQNSLAIQRKLTTISRRKKMIRLLVECEAVDETRREVLLLLQQQLRVEILLAGYVPGCRAELEHQLSIVSPDRSVRWSAENRAWLERLASRPAASTVMAAADHYAGSRVKTEQVGIDVGMPR